MSVLRRAARFVGLAIFAVLVTVIVSRALVTSTVSGIAGILQRKRLSAYMTFATARIATSASTLEPTLIVICTFVLWGISLRWVDVSAMNDLGLVSVLPITSLIALAGLMLAFVLSLNSLEDVHPFVPLSCLLALIFMLYATPALVEQEPRFAVTYWLAGHTEYVLRTGTVAPGLDAYFNWPGFFLLTGLLTKISGQSSVLAFAPWASFVYNLLYLAPLYLIFRALTQDRRTVWLGMWFFCISDWVWQDYFDPQGLNFFFYLIIIAILLRGLQTARETRLDSKDIGTSLRRWLLRYVRRQRGDMEQRTAWWASHWTRVKSIRPAQAWANSGGFSGHASRLRRWARLSDMVETPEQHRKRIVLLSTIIVAFALSVVSHPITPIFILLSVTALTLTGRIMPRWLPILFAAMILGWDFTAAMPYMAGHLQSDLASFGNIQVIASSNVTNRLVAGSAGHQFISHARVVLTAAIWGLAALGFVLRWQSDATPDGAVRTGGAGIHAQNVMLLSLVATPGLLVIAQPYGGEMAMRFYLFTLPIVSFFAAVAFRTRFAFRVPARVQSWWGTAKRSRASRWATTRSMPIASICVAVTCLLLLGGFLFARYGNEHADYITPNEANAISYLYQVAPAHSLLLAGWDGTPWRYQDLELYTYSQLYTGQDQAAAFEAHNVSSIVERASNPKYPATYVVFSHTQQAQAELFSGVPPTAFPRMESALLASGMFRVIYRNPDAEILMYIPPATKNQAPLTPEIQRGRSW